MEKTLDNLIECIDQRSFSQENVDRIYKELIEKIFAEMDKYLDVKSVKSKTRKMCKFSKPYWNSELTALWKDMCRLEKHYLKMSF